MSASHVSDSAKSRLQAVIVLAGILERMEHNTSLDANQYQVVVARLKEALSADLPDDTLQAILNAHPAAAELYENMHYKLSGLSRLSLDQSISTETLAAQAIARVARSSKAGQ
jgi:hypothetical protein